MQPRKNLFQLNHPLLTPLSDLENIGELILDSEGIILGANNTAVLLLKTSLQKLVQQNVCELVSHHTDRLTQILEQVRLDGFVQDEISLDYQDGSGNVGMQISLTLASNQSNYHGCCSFFFKTLDHGDWQVTALAKKEARFRFALESADIGVWDMDIQKNETFRSPLHDYHFGYSTPLKDWGYDDFISHVAKEDRERVADAYYQAMQGGEEYDVQFRVVWPDSSVHWMWSKGRFYLKPDGTPVRVAGLTADVTDVQMAKEEMQLARRSIDASSEGIVIVDAMSSDLVMVNANPAFYNLTGYSVEEVIGNNCRFLQGEDTDVEQVERLRTAIKEQQEATVLLKNYRKSGEAFWNRLTIAPVKNDLGQVTHFVGLQRDVTQEIQLKQDLEFRATHDELTGLRNRKKFTADLHDNIAGYTEEDFLAVYFIDIDHFKHINDYWDHATGDLVLQNIAQKLAVFEKKKGIAGRFGGDEFCLAVSGLSSANEIERVANELLNTLSVPVSVREHTIVSSVSIGVSVFPTDSHDVSTLIAYADDALLQAKKSGRAMQVRFDEHRRLERLAEYSLESKLKKAIENQELAVHYQPKFNSLSNQLMGFEALLRWMPNKREAIPPTTFIPLAESSGLIHEIGHWTITEVFQQQSHWRAKGYELVTVAINVSNVQLESSNLAEFIIEQLSFFDLPGSLIEIELTETVGVYNSVKLINFMAMLRPYGITFAIDDFGTGHSNLSYLRQYSFDCIKIDRQFVVSVLDITDDAAICRSIVALANIFSMRVVAEGIEDKETADFLQRIGCFELQGYLYSKPVAPELAMAFLKIVGAVSIDRVTTPISQTGIYSPYEMSRQHSIKYFELDKPLKIDALQAVIDLLRSSFEVESAFFNLIFNDLTIEKISSHRTEKGHQKENVHDRAFTLCSHTVLGSTIYTVPNLAEHPIHKSHPMVVGSEGLRFYAGISVYAPDGKVIGALCIIDRAARELTSSNHLDLHRFANLFEECLFYYATSKLKAEYKLRHERHYDLELSGEWRHAAQKALSFGILVVCVDHNLCDASEDLFLTDKVSSLLNQFQHNFDVVVYRLQDDSFHIMFKGFARQSIEHFWALFEEELHENVQPERLMPITHNIAYTSLASGSTNELQGFLKKLK